MPERIVVYGEIGDSAERGRLLNEADPSKKLIWRDDDDLFDPSDSKTTVNVDLDDPRYCRADFLLSIATAGKTVKVVGISKSPDVDQAIQVSKLGVSRILTPDKGLQQFDHFLNECESDLSDKTGPSMFASQALIGVSPQIEEIR